jgi:hypothetical protein
MATHINSAKKKETIMSTLTLRYPSLRMAIGRFGMWLVRVGRELQTRYANWNSEFRMKFETYTNPDLATLHVSERVTDEYEMTFMNVKCQLGKQTPLVKALFGIRGVSYVRPDGYTVNFQKSDLFTWEELRPDIERVALECLTKK